MTDIEVPTRTLVEIRNLEAGYGRLKVLKGISLDVTSGEILGIIGHNGAGKSTLLKTIAGVLETTNGTIRFIRGPEPGTDEPISVAMVPQGLAVFPRMTVQENLEVPAVARRDKTGLASLEEIFEIFPPLKLRIGQMAGTMSGGEQRMLAVGMALRLAPELLLLDEPSLGLAPNLVTRIMESVDEARERFGSTLIIVEQNLDALLHRADRLVAIRQGIVVWEGDPASISDVRELWEHY